MLRIPTHAAVLCTVLPPSGSNWLTPFFPQLVVVGHYDALLVDYTTLFTALGYCFGGFEGFNYLSSPVNQAIYGGGSAAPDRPDRPGFFGKHRNQSLVS